MRSDVTHILTAMEQGNPSAAESLLPLVYQELQKLAAAKLSHEHARTERPFRAVPLSIHHFVLFAVTPGQSSVRNGVVGRPVLEYRLTTGLLAQA